MVSDQPFYFLPSGGSFLSEGDVVLTADTISHPAAKSGAGQEEIASGNVSKETEAEKNISQSGENPNVINKQIKASAVNDKNTAPETAIPAHVKSKNANSNAAAPITLAAKNTSTGTPGKERSKIADEKQVNASPAAADSVKNETGNNNSDIFRNETTELPKPVSRVKASPLSEYSDWLAAFLIISLVTVGFLRISSNKYLRELFNSAFYSQAASKMYSSVNMRNSFPSFILSLLFIVNTGVFIFELMTFYGSSVFDEKGFNLLLIIWGILVGFGIIKGALYRIAGFAFDASAPTGEYLFNASLLSKVFAIIILPVIAIIPFVNQWLVPNLIKLGIAVFFFLYILQLIRGARIILQNSFSVFYMFLYFCALEIFPLVILYKILFN